MKLHLGKATVLFGLLGLALVVSANAQSTDNDYCTDATVHGDYGFTVSGQIFFSPELVVQREGVAMAHFDGMGKFTQVDLVLSSPNAPPPPGTVPTDPTTHFHTDEWGTYSVHTDCTGTFTIHFPAFTTPTGGSVPGAIIVVNFVLSNGGRTIHAVVTSLTPPGGSGPVPALLRSEGHKLGPVGQD